jgi:murein DD-endopeptidase MepM/ murein hydrolase activator NlpD
VPLFSSASGASVKTLKERLAAKQAELNTAYAEYSKFQDELNVLAEKQNAAEIRMAQIEDAINGVENQIALAQKDMDIAQAQLAERLVSLYKDNYSSAPVYLEILLEESDFVSVIQRFSMIGRMADQDQELFEQVESYLEKSQGREAELAQKKQEQAEVMAELESLQAEMSEKFSAASAEYERLTSQVLDLRDQVREAEEEAARAAAAAAAAKARAEAEAKANKANTSRSNYSGGTVQGGGFVFPVQGPHSFIDSWGAPRSGGRTHKGTDILASRGTPVVACVSGTVSRTNPKDTGLGGITVWLRGNNGYSYYYAHLDGIASGIRAGTSVSAGQLLGWVGSTGNAGTCNHLHFCSYTSSGTATNPYATLRAAD